MKKLLKRFVEWMARKTLSYKDVNCEYFSLMARVVIALDLNPCQEIELLEKVHTLGKLKSFSDRGIKIMEVLVLKDIYKMIEGGCNYPNVVELLDRRIKVINEREIR